MEQYKNEAEYLSALKKRAVLPKGFKSGCINFKFSPKELPNNILYPMNISAILLDNSTEIFGGVFTKNTFPGAPVILGKKRIKSNQIRGVVINNKISNVCTKDGMANAEILCNKSAEIFGGASNEYFSSSTGVIGWELPINEMVENLPLLKNELNDNSILDVSKAIMTTDAFPKVRSVSLGEGRITAIAKGAGMIEPNMATMLVFIVTDIKISKKDIQSVLSGVCEKTFNRISIDSDQSTSDMALIFSSNEKEMKSLQDFKDGLFNVCRDLAVDIVRNGEGAGHVIHVSINNALDSKSAVKIGKGIINSPLVKTAIFGNDPNVGRLIMSVGDIAGNSGISIDPKKVEIYIGDVNVFSKGFFTLTPEIEVKLSKYLEKRKLSPELKGYFEHSDNVEIKIDLGMGTVNEEVFGSDLTYEYIRENAEYRT